ncbi:virulence-associated E family protein [Atopococcus tabaci]|uniref:virulence-associated E family protein n=1 Tax=Atopococcus tabaci TaxID=269774 RepID=UPI000687C35A|nr:virulence-associated E family protein [Atopococcus tabaci]
MQQTTQMNISEITPLKHDTTLTIAAANSRTVQKWTNKQKMWSEMLTLLSRPTITHETQEEYQKMSKSEQSDIKDVGGFVGAGLKSGIRKKGYVQARSLITLDADYATEDLWEDFKLLFEHAAAIYTTHSHTKEKPKYRIIIPLKEAVFPDEYEPLARKVADLVGVDKFDDTTYQAERLMFWPSCSQDGEFFFDYQDLPLLDPNEVLKQYDDWKDFTSWPKSSRQKDILKREVKKAENPLDKNGVVGAFCKAYDIHEAIETFLEDVYEPTSQPNRYTYTDGSSHGGLVIYEDRFAYSHHATDPVGDKLTNAFDLVRLHLFGELDAETSHSTPVNKLPSYTRMAEFVREDSKARRGLILSAVNEDFAEELEEAEEEDLSWLDQLHTTKSGKIENEPYNARLILQNDPELKGLVGFNQFNQQIEKLKQPKWETVLEPQFRDRDMSEIRILINERYQVAFSQKNLEDAVVTVAEMNPFHPVKQFIEKETWDGEQRISSLLIEYLGAPDELYTREVAELFFAAAVSRIYRPGCKFDYVLLVVGPQGIGKSTFFARLAPEWFTDSLEGLGNSKDDMQLLSDNWIVELGELASLSRTDLDRAKNFLSRTEDNYRKPYAKNNIKVKRHVVFAGTTNDYASLKDATGNRRFWPVIANASEQKKKPFDGSLDKIRHQIWAEALHLFKTKYKEGKGLTLSEEAAKVALERQKENQAEDPLQEDIREYLDFPIPVDWYEHSQIDRASYINQVFIQGREWHEIDEPHFSEETMERDRITTKEVLAELMQRSVGDMDLRQNSLAKKIGMAINGLDDWERKTIKLPRSGKARQGFKRMKKGNK